MPDPTPLDWYSVRNEAGTPAADVAILGTIGTKDGNGVGAMALSEQLAAIAAPTINLTINSDGGSVFEGLAIYNALKSHPARVVVDIRGLAASIASVVAMAGDEIRIAKNAYVMIHNPMGVIAGDADALRHTADNLDKMAATLAGIYAERSGVRTAEQFRALMDAETWLTAREAKSLGLVDVITEADGTPITARAGAAEFFNRAPEPLKQLIAAAGRSGDGTTPPTPATADPVPAERKAAMPDATPAAAGTPQAVAPNEVKPATIAELETAFPGDPAFALGAAKEALTLVEAKAKYADVLATRLASTQSELAAARAQATAPAAPAAAPAGNKPLGGNAVADATNSVVYGTAKAEFNAEVRRLVTSGEYDHGAAVRFIAKGNPDLYQRVLDEANPPKPAPRK